LKYPRTEKTHAHENKRAGQRRRLAYRIHSGSLVRTLIPIIIFLILFILLYRSPR
jgi:hypothetical protein